MSAQPVRSEAPVEPIELIAERVPASLAATQARFVRHFHPCDYWLRLDPAACTCEARPVVDLLLAIAGRAIG